MLKFQNLIDFDLILWITVDFYCLMSLMMHVCNGWCC